MKKKLLALMVIAALSVGMLAGCGGGEAEPAAEPAQPQQETVPAAEAEAEGEDAGTEELVNEILSTLTLGYAGVSEAGEELYLAVDENVDYGILGIVSDGEATFLSGDITESDDGLTITDISTGNSLTFTVSEPETDADGDVFVTIEVVSNGAEAVLYACDVSAVIDAMSQY